MKVGLNCKEHFVQSIAAAELKTEIEADLFCGLSLFSLLENQSKIHHIGSDHLLNTISKEIKKGLIKHCFNYFSAKSYQMKYRLETLIRLV